MKIYVPMLIIYLFRNPSPNGLYGHRADEVVTCSDEHLIQSFSELGIGDYVPILGKKEYFIDPTNNSVVSGKHAAGSKLKISAQDLINPPNKFFWKKLWASNLRLQFHANQNTSSFDPRKVIYVFHRTSPVSVE